VNSALQDVQQLGLVPPPTSGPVLYVVLPPPGTPNLLPSPCGEDLYQTQDINNNGATYVEWNFVMGLQNLTVDGFWVSNDEDLT